jgi:hypothetical protein
MAKKYWKSDIKNKKINGSIANMIWGIREGNCIAWPCIERSNIPIKSKKYIGNKMTKLEKDLDDFLKAINFGWK